MDENHGTSRECDARNEAEAVQSTTSGIARAGVPKHVVGIVLLSVVLSGVDQWLAQWLLRLELAWAFELVLTAVIAFALVRFVRHLQTTSRKQPLAPPSMCAPPVPNWTRCRERPPVRRKSCSSSMPESDVLEKEVDLPQHGRDAVDEIDLEAWARHLIERGGNIAAVFTEMCARVPERNNECVQAVIRACVTTRETARGALWLEEMQRNGMMDAKSLLLVMNAFYLLGNDSQGERMLFGALRRRPSGQRLLPDVVRADLAESCVCSCLASARNRCWCGHGRLRRSLDGLCSRGRYRVSEGMDVSGRSCAHDEVVMQRPFVVRETHARGKRTIRAGGCGKMVATHAGR